jgi:hypothetical protein
MAFLFYVRSPQSRPSRLQRHDGQVSGLQTNANGMDTNDVRYDNASRYLNFKRFAEPMHRSWKRDCRKAAGKARTDQQFVSFRNTHRPETNCHNDITKNNDLYHCHM